MKNITVNFFEELVGNPDYPNSRIVSITKTREEWIDDLTNYMLDLSYQDGEFANGLIDDLLRGGFKGYWAMTKEELIAEIKAQLDHFYDEEIENATI